MTTTALLFEIGVEEIPSGYFQGARGSILAKAPKLLNECGFQAEGLEVFATPKRIVVYTPSVKSIKLEAEEKTGPLKAQSYDENGNSTKALAGFLKSVEKKESDMYLKETPRGECVCVKVTKKYKPLQYFFETLPRVIEFPKLMRWESGRFAFTRPIRSVFAFLGNSKQIFKIADVKSGNSTGGHRFLGKGKNKVSGSNFEKFEKLLKSQHVILKESDRLAMIKSFLKSAHHYDEELVDSVLYLVEEPYPVKGEFPKEYLKLPPEILEICMKKHQRIFACYDSSGKIVNCFIAIIDGKRKDVKQIAKHYERVLCSRLEDARFFFHEDSKTTLASQTPKLKELIFLGALGSYFDKSARVRSLVKFLGEASGVPSDVIQRAERAAELAKADLVTHLVYELPELQGAAGAHYAKLDGEHPHVVRAISGHYLPRNLYQDYRELKKELDMEGSLVGLCDRMDLLVGALGLGIELSGSQDPYALRRAAGGIAKILRAYPLRFRFSEWVQTAHRQYGGRITVSDTELLKKLRPFLFDRIIFELQIKLGSREYEILQGVFASEVDDIANIYKRFEQLAAQSTEESFIRACKVLERTRRILKGIKEKVSDVVNPAYFEDPLEKAVYELVLEKGKEIQALAGKEEYTEAVRCFGDAFYQPIHDFFDQVKVNADNADIRVNRQALMNQVNRIFSSQVADLSYVTNLS